MPEYSQYFQRFALSLEGGLPSPRREASPAIEGTLHGCQVGPLREGEATHLFSVSFCCFRKVLVCPRSFFLVLFFALAGTRRTEALVPNQLTKGSGLLSSVIVATVVLFCLNFLVFLGEANSTKDDP